MTEGTTVYCGDNCNHTGPHHYPPPPPHRDPRLDALLAAARELLDLIDRRVDFGAYMSDDAKADALRDALAAFEEPV